MTNTTLETMQSMRLTGMANAYQAALNLPVNQQLDTHQLIAQLIDAEQQHRSFKRMKLFIRLSKMRYAASITDIECSTNRNLNKTQLNQISNTSLLDRAENILITGATGCGKSYLACAIGNNACVHGYRTLYFNMNRFTEQISLAKTDGTLIKWLDKIKKAKLIILDDFGLQPINHSVKLTLLQILEDRYENTSTLICSQLPIKKWYDYFDEPTIADAILDRLIPKAHRINLKGKSLRKRANHLS